MRKSMLRNARFCFLVLSSLLGEAQTITPAVDPSRYKFLIGTCDGSYRVVCGVVSKDVDLSLDNTAKTLLELGAAAGQRQCPHSQGFGNISVGLYYGDPATFTAEKFNFKGVAFSRMMKSTYGDSAYPDDRSAVSARNYSNDPTKFNWREYDNHPRDLKARAAEAVRRAAEAERQAMLAKVQKAAEELQARVAAQRTESFLKKAGTRQIVALGDVCQNPFLYQGKAVVFALRGGWEWKATSPTSVIIQGIGISCGFSMTGIPAHLLTREFNGSKVVAVKVLGNQQGSPLVQYVHHEQCSEGGCGDIPGIK